MLYRRLPTNKRGDENLVQESREHIWHSSCLQKHVTLTLIIKAIDSINRGAFMVSTQQEKVLWIFNLVG